MSRTLTAAMQTALQQTVVRPIYFFECAFSGYALYLCTANFDVSFAGQTWLGNGWLVAIGEIQEVAEQRATAMNVTLAGGDSTLLSLVLASGRQYNNSALHFGLLDSAGALIADPTPLFIGKYDKAMVRDNGHQTVIQIDLEGDIIDQKRVVEFRYTNQSQQALFPGDTGFNKVPQAAIWKGFWGKAAKVQFIRKRNLTRH